MSLLTWLLLLELHLGYVRRLRLLVRGRRCPWNFAGLVFGFTRVGLRGDAFGSISVGASLFACVSVILTIMVDVSLTKLSEPSSK